jgi:homoserine O-acetyltransferase
MAPASFRVGPCPEGMPARVGATGLVSVASPARPLPLDGGGRLDHASISVATYGERDRADRNVVLVCPCLTADARVTRRDPGDDSEPRGWWESLVGPGRPIDTGRFFVIGTDPLGGSGGSTGPASIDPASGRPHGTRFPRITIGDLVEAQVRVLDALGIDAPVAVIGGSIGGFQALELARRHPGRVHTVLALATGPRLGAFGLAFNAVGRAAIAADPDFRGGGYGLGAGPREGLGVARRIAHLTYRSATGFDRRFGRDASEIAAYLDRRAEAFVRRFDANSYLRLLEAMDGFDLAAVDGTLVSAMCRIRADLMLGGFTSDWLFPPDQTRELASAARAAGVRVHERIIATDDGHDAFLLPGEALSRLACDFASRVSEHLS